MLKANKNTDSKDYQIAIQAHWSGGGKTEVILTLLIPTALNERSTN